MTEVGKQRRMAKMLGSGPSIVLPIDEGLISGPIGGLGRLRELLEPRVVEQVDAVLGFRGALTRCADQLVSTGTVLNVTASTVLMRHTEKVVVGTAREAIALGADALAFHLNVSDPSEGTMLRGLGEAVEAADVLGLPIVAIAYPRRAGRATGRDDNYLELREADEEAFAALVAHAVRIAVELGADAVKTVFTGSAETFATVVDAALGVPVLMAGGPVDDDDRALARAEAAIRGGAAGVAFGRQVLMHERPVEFLQRMRATLDAAVAPAPVAR